MNLLDEGYTIVMFKNELNSYTAVTQLPGETLRQALEEGPVADGRCVV